MKPLSVFSRPSLDGVRALRDARSIATTEIRRGVRAAAERAGAADCVVDVGAGRATWRGLFPRSRRYIAFDVAPLPESQFVASATHIPLRDGLADLVLCTEVLEHVRDTPLLLSEIGRVLKPGGHLILSTPLLWGVHDRTDYYRWTADGLRVLLAGHGLRPVRIYRRGGIFATIAALIDQVPFQLLSGDPTRFSAMGSPARVRYLASAAVQLLLTPLVWLIAAGDRFDRAKRFTLGYVVLARKV